MNRHQQSRPSFQAEQSYLPCCKILSMIHNSSCFVSFFRVCRNFLFSGLFFLTKSFCIFSAFCYIVIYTYYIVYSVKCNNVIKTPVNSVNDILLELRVCLHQELSRPARFCCCSAHLSHSIYEVPEAEVHVFKCGPCIHSTTMCGTKQRKQPIKRQSEDLTSPQRYVSYLLTHFLILTSGLLRELC